MRATADDERETTRLEAFSDGVIAIAITLLILEIRVAEIEDASPKALWSALRGLWPNFLGYVISFATIGITWANHHTIFRYIALMADALGHPAERVGVIVYSGWFLLTALSYTLLWTHAARGNRLIDLAADPAAVHSISARFRLGPPAYAVAFVLAFISPPLSLAVLLRLALLYVLPYGNPAR